MTHSKYYLIFCRWYNSVKLILKGVFQLIKSPYLFVSSTAGPYSVARLWGNMLKYNINIAHSKNVLKILIIFKNVNKLDVCLFGTFSYTITYVFHDYPSLSSNFYHQGKNNQFNHLLFVMIIKVIVQTFNTIQISISMALLFQYPN